MRLVRGILVLSIAILLAWSFNIHKWTYTYGGYGMFSWDAGSYYSYLPAFFYDDIYAPEKVAAEITERQLMGGMLPFHYHPETGRAVMRYPIGEAIAFSPGFLIAHVLAKEHDGFNETYTKSLAFWGLLLAFLGLWLLYLVLRRYFSALVSALLIFTYIFATNYLQYAAADFLHPHSLLFSLYALLVYMADNYYRNQKPRNTQLFLMGLLCGLMAITRPTDALSILIPLFWGSHSWKIFRERIVYWFRHPSKIVVLAIGVLVTVSIQMIYWQLCTGHWIYNSYQEQLNFSWLNPHLNDYLFSYRKGWFIYTPIMLLSIVGIIWTLKVKKYQAFLVFIFMSITIYMLSAWDVWWYGGSFSQRSIVQSYVMLAFPMSFMIHKAFAKKWSKYLFLAVLLILGYTNINLHYLAGPGNYYETSSMNRRYFWKTLWTWNKPPEYRRFLDVQYEMPEDMVKDLKPLYSQDFENWKAADTTQAHSGQKSYRSASDNAEQVICKLPVSRSCTWVRAEAWVYIHEANWDSWSLFEMKIKQESDGYTNQQEIKPQRFIREVGVWKKISWDLRLDQNMVKEISVTFRNNKPELGINIDDLSLYYYEEPTF